jgi:folylpolyglutamate synthase
MAVHAPPSSTDIERAILAGLQATRWPGRCQVVRRPGVTWYLDGAHTIESLAACASWYTGASERKPKRRVLIFNCTSDRTGATLLAGLYDCLLGSGDQPVAFDRVILTTNTTYRDGQSKGGAPAACPR